MSFFTAHALLEGLDPEALLHETWVERVSLPLLRGSDSKALLSFDQLRERVPEVLAPDGPARADPEDIEYRQSRSLALHVQLTGLRGLTYPIRGLRRDSPVSGATYADWGRFKLQPRGGLEQMLEPAGRSPLDFVLASAASPGASLRGCSIVDPTPRPTRATGSRTFPSPVISGTRTAGCSARSRSGA